MSIKINLLPGYIAWRRRWRTALWASAALLGLVGLVLVLAHLKGQNELAVRQADLENIEPFAKATETAEATTLALEQEAAPMQSFVDFSVAAGKTGPERAALLDLVRRYIYGGAVVRSIDISNGQTVNISATMATTDDYARFLLNLRRGTAPEGLLFSSLPTASGVPGGPNDRFVLPRPGEQPITINFPLNVAAQGTLKNPVAVPTEAGAAPAAAGGGGGGYGGGGGGYGGGGYGGGGYGGR